MNKFGTSYVISSGYYTDKYFLRSIRTLKNEGLDPQVTMQFFAKKDGIVVGIDEAIEIIETSIDPDDYNKLEVRAVEEGSEMEPKVPVMYITGPYNLIGHLETPILGVLARRSLIATNTKLVVDEANGKPVIFMAARHDDYRLQEGDGYSALIGGADSVSTDANGYWMHKRGIGTMPHALIAAMGGDVPKATIAFHRTMQKYEPNVRTISLVDYNNDCVTDSIRTAYAMEREFGKGKLFAVRLDTSESMIDKSLQEDWVHHSSSHNGVNVTLVNTVREALDENEFEDVGIVVSGGFTPEKIRLFEENDAPVIAYGVGSSILGHSETSLTLHNNIDFTADIVKRNGELEAKVGREFIENENAVVYELKKDFNKTEAFV